MKSAFMFSVIFGPTTSLPWTATPTAAAPSPTSALSPTSSPPPSATPAPASETPTPAPAAPATPIAQPTQTTPAAADGTGSACTNVAGYFGDVTIPDGTAFKQKQSFIKTWRIRNEGTCVWGQGYAVVFQSGDQMSGPLSAPMPAAAPGEIIDISVNMVAPPSGGTFTGFWDFQTPNGSRFGTGSSGHDQLWVKIGVTIFDAEGTSIPVGSTPVATTRGQGAGSPVTSSATSSSPTSSNAASSTPGAGCAPQPNPVYDQHILEKINAARTQAGLNALVLNPKLSAAALVHSVDLACNHFVDHTGSDGSTWYTRITAQGYNWSWASENTYVGNPAFGGTPDGAFTWWMNSKIHHDTIFSTKFNEVGVAYVFLPGSDWGGYYNVEFAHP